MNIYIVISIYIAIVILFWWIIKRYVLRKTEKFDDVKLKTFGTLLNDNPTTLEQSKEFKTISFPRESFLPVTDELEQLKRESVHIERFDSIQDDGTVKTTFRSFGTLLKNHEQVENLSNTFKTVKMKGAKFDIPKSFDGREAWKNLLCPIKDQGSCGNCWAHSSSSVLADRFSIFSLGQIKFNPSPAEITVCAKDYLTDPSANIQKIWKNKDELKKMDEKLHTDGSCNGNTLYNVAQILYIDGITEIECFPDKSDAPEKYNIPKVEDPKSIPYCYDLEGITFDKCIDGKTLLRKYRCQTAYNIPNVELAIMDEIYRNGPVLAGFLIFPDFMYGYDGKTIYTHSNKEGDSLGGHAISIYGWGEENNIPYWIIKNSWGTDWGNDGFFKIQRGLKECQLENNAMGMIPDFIGLAVLDTSIIPVETKDEIDVRNYSNHFLNPSYGFYQNKLDEITTCSLQTDQKILPYIDPSFKLPDYNVFLAGEVNKYITQPNPKNNGQEVKCGVVISNGKPVLNENNNISRSKYSIPEGLIDLLFLIILLNGSLMMFKYRYLIESN
jgi:cathepsin B